MKRPSLLAALLLATLPLLGAAAEDEWYWGKPVASIQWEGVSHADRKALDGLARPYIGKPFTQDLWTELQGRVYELEWFDSIDPQAFPASDAKTEVVIRIFVDEKPAVGQVRITGNSGLRATEILDVVKTKAGDIYNLQSARLDELAVRSLYLEKGYTGATVSSAASSPSAKGEVDLTFTVDEGSKVAVRSIRFSGSAALSEKTLKAQLGLKEAGLFQDGSFQESKLEADKGRIVELYRSRGYIDAAVTDVVRSYDKDPKNGRGLLDLTFVVKEGKPWVLASIGFEGNSIFSTEKLAVLISQKAGGLVNYQRLLADKQRVDDLYFESGYIFNAIDLLDARDQEKGTVAYVIRIVERDRAHIESIVFKGNTKSKEEVLYRELPLQVGDVFSKAKIIEGLRNLYNLQYFSSIQPEMRPGSAEGLMALVLNVEEQSTADVQFGVTLSGLGDPTAFPVSGLLKWGDKNFLGNGQTFGVELNASPDTQSLTFSFLDNWLLRQRLTGGIDLSFDHKTTTTPQDIVGPVFADGVPDPYSSYAEYQAANFAVPSEYLAPYDKWEFRLGLNTGYGWTTAFGNFGVGLGISSGLTSIDYDTAKYRPALKSVRDSEGSWVLGNKLVSRAYLNRLDYWVNPTTGYYGSQKLTLAGLLPGEPQHYLRSDSRLDGFVTLFTIPVIEVWNLKLVLGAHTGLQVLLPGPGLAEPVVSTEDSLHIDGTFVGRGWRSLISYDGRMLWENWVELRMPIFEQVVWLDGFAEAASLMTSRGLLRPGGADPYSEAGAALSWDNLAMSIGFGFRFTVPQFPFRFYFAKRFLFDGSTFSFPNQNFDFVISISQPLN